MPSKYARKTSKPKEVIPEKFAKAYILMWNTLQGLAECPGLCPECREKAEAARRARFGATAD